MDINSNRNNLRQMYTNDSETGRMKLQSVKENLYEATTKVVLYSIEMYTKKDLSEWVSTDLYNNIEKANKDLNREKEELALGHIGAMDITNGCSVINDFVRRDALNKARIELTNKISDITDKINELVVEENLVEERRRAISEGEITDDDIGRLDSDVFYMKEDEDDSINNEEGSENEVVLEDDIDDDKEEEDSKEKTEVELLSERLAGTNDIDQLSNIAEQLLQERVDLESTKTALAKLTGNGGNQLGVQDDYERSGLENLRILRNTGFAHKNEDQIEISMIGTWQPEAGPLYQWASEILNYLKIIDRRYECYGLFDEFYKSKEKKDLFDSCKVYVRKQIQELYVNRSNISFEFAGELFEKEDEEYNFYRLIRKMAKNWDTGIRYLTVVTNDDMPEMNDFFKECLSGTNRYVDRYLIYRNELRNAYKKDPDSVDYVYFKLLYSLASRMEKIYWKGKIYTKRDFSRQIIYKFLKTKNSFHLEARLRDPDMYTDGIDIVQWSKHHILSDYFFKYLDDDQGCLLSKEMEDNILAFMSSSSQKKVSQYKKVIRSSALLYFYLGEETAFIYNGKNDRSVEWHNLDDARRYIECGKHFDSYSDLCGFINEVSASEYFRIWKRESVRKEDMEAHDDKTNNDALVR